MLCLARTLFSIPAPLSFPSLRFAFAFTRYAVSAPGFSRAPLGPGRGQRQLPHRPSRPLIRAMLRSLLCPRVILLSSLLVPLAFAAPAVPDGSSAPDGTSTARGASAPESRSGSYLVIRPLNEPRGFTMDSVLRDLRAGLLPRGIRALKDPEAAEEKQAPLAMVMVTFHEQRVEIEIADELTHKQVKRVTDLSALAEDGHSLALALAIDELLRASWAELYVPRGAGDLASETSTAKEPQKSVPKESVPAPHVAPATEEKAGLAVAARFAYLRFASGLDLFGGDLEVRVPSGPIWYQVGLGGRASSLKETTLGRVAADAYVGILGVGYDFASGQELVLGPRIRLLGGVMRARGEPNQGAQGTDLTGAMGAIDLGMCLGKSFGPLELTLDGGVALPANSLRARAGAATVLEISGPAVELGLSGGLSL